ncbi:transcriptional regulator with XRE-family HTH domain [Bradyrhizobium sp. i1.15.2]|uniref:helix-turn-helix domain-containing protein n=1 Tax=Bradyrhizobium sp. i1.15.2 TaxID=3156362 RepID=UPI0033988197
MKLASESKRALVGEIQARMEARKLVTTQFAQSCGVDQSQISRVLAGDFKGVSHNVMQICIHLGIDPMRFFVPSREDEFAKKRIMESALAVWDGTPEDADLLVSVLGGMAAMRSARPK